MRSFLMRELSDDPKEKSMAHTLLTFAAGAAVGAAAFTLFSAPSDGPPAPPNPAPTTRPVPAPPPTAPKAPGEAPSPPPSTATPARPAPPPPTCKATLAARDVELKLVRAQLKSFAGEVVPWPEDMPEAWTFDGLPGRVEDALAPYADTVDMDCSEYPCLAALRVDPAFAEGKELPQILEALDEAHTAAGLPFSPPSVFTADDTLYLIGAYADAGTAPAPETRVLYRASFLRSDVHARHAQTTEAPE